MAYSAIYRNNNPVQFGTIILTLYLTNSDGVMPNVRRDIKLRYPDQCTEEALAGVAQMVIDMAVLDYELSLLPQETVEAEG